MAQVEQSFADVSVGAGATAARHGEPRLGTGAVRLPGRAHLPAFGQERHDGHHGPQGLAGGRAAAVHRLLRHGCRFDYGLGDVTVTRCINHLHRAAKIASTPGLYEIDTYRTDDPASLVSMWDYFQVCTFKASASTIRHGKTVRLSGMVPAAAGRVTLYSTTHKVAGQPKTPGGQGLDQAGHLQGRLAQVRDRSAAPQAHDLVCGQVHGLRLPGLHLGHQGDRPLTKR